LKRSYSFLYDTQTMVVLNFIHLATTISHPVDASHFQIGRVAF